MANVLGATCIDSGIVTLKNTATEIHILSADPTTFSDVATFTLGKKVFTAGTAFATPTTGDVNGRKTLSTAITDGSVTATGTAAKWAVVTASALLANGTLSSTQSVTVGNTFTLAAFKIEVPDR